MANAETNTECVFLSPSAASSNSKGKHPHSSMNTNTGLTVPLNDSNSVSSLVRRSQTFSPSAPINKNDYVCKLNRSDSDGAMPLYKRLPLQRRMLERRSLRLPSHPMKSMVPSHLPPNKLSIAEGHEIRLHSGATAKGVKSIKSKSSNSSANKLQTPLDLTLDLAAQQSRLKILQDEIDRLKAIKSKMEETKTKGNKDVPDWLQEDEPFQELLSKFQPESYGAVGKSHEERRVEKMIRKTGRDIYKLRKTRVARGEMDVHSFKEKMAFFTTMRAKIPLLPPDLESQDTQFNHPLDDIDDEDDDDDNDSGSDCEITDDVIRRRLQMLESFIEKDEHGAGGALCEGLGTPGSGNLPGDISKNSTLKHSDFAELPLSSPPLTQELPPPLADNSTNSSSSRSSTTPTKGVSPPVTVTVNGQVQNFSVSPPDFPPPPPPPDYSDDTTASASIDYRYRFDRTTKLRNVRKNCDLYLGDDSDGDRIGNDDSVNSSACSTPTPTSSSALDKHKERYDYEIDPDIGVIV